MSNPPPPVKAEHHSSPTPTPQPPETTPVQDPLPLAITTNPPQQQTSQNHRPHPPQQPQLTDSVTALRPLSDALSAFHRRYDELQEHLDFIRTSIDSKLLQLLDTEIVPITESVPITETLVSDTAKTDDNSPSPESEIEKLCRDNCSLTLRRYIVSHLQNVSKLREEVPSALKFAPNPAKLVMKCFGRFFLQGIRAYDKASPMIASRQASVLVLEFFMLMGCEVGEVEEVVRKDAEEAAVEWRRRLVGEGGLGKACEVDARGLLLLIGCFGIPKVFRNEDVKDLIRASNAGEICDALRRSSVLLAKIPEIIEWMLKTKMEVEAVDIVFIFGMESRFPPETILTSFLQESKETWKKARKTSQGSSAAVNKANKKNLADMKLVLKCVKYHKIDPLKALPGWNLNEKIFKLEKDIADIDKKIGEQIKPKRKADELESSKRPKSQEVKRTRFSGPVPEQQKAAAYVDHMASFDGLTPMTSLGGGVPQYSTYSPYSSVLHGASVGPSLGTGTHLHGARAGAVMSAGAGNVLPTGHYSGVHGGVLVDRVGHVINTTGQPYGWHGEASYRDRLVGQSYAEPAALGTNGLNRATLSMEGFAGFPNPSSIGVSNRSSNSDLYQFADAIVERETYASSRTGGTIPPRVAPAHHSSYLY
ncbi:Protein FRIGIDA like [Actinidia chinensis var. chinensis]|uniref:FRIGIDA-like protein n=1 Tax=Actinidia chinensis var. chinensis TaxID=1590841 RepID=A0A2R6PVM2_ACTCC|nr:Protein FRIGIDA like [Actinidia chinensis var. chinensis]